MGGLVAPSLGIYRTEADQRIAIREVQPLAADDEAGHDPSVVNELVLHNSGVAYLAEASALLVARVGPKPGRSSCQLCDLQKVWR